MTTEFAHTNAHNENHLMNQCFRFVPHMRTPNVYQLNNDRYLVFFTANSPDKAPKYRATIAPLVAAHIGDNAGAIGAAMLCSTV